MNSPLRSMLPAYNVADGESIFQLEVSFPAIHGYDAYYTDALMAYIRSSGKRVWMNALGKFDAMENNKKDAGFEALLQMKQINLLQWIFLKQCRNTSE